MVLQQVKQIGTPAKAGVQDVVRRKSATIEKAGSRFPRQPWIPAFAEM